MTAITLTAPVLPPALVALCADLLDAEDAVDWARSMGTAPAVLAGLRRDRDRARKAFTRGCDAAVRAEVDGYAGTIMAMITEDIAAGIVPATVASFTELHDHVDANGYTTIVPDLPDGTFDTDTINRVCAEVSRRLAGTR